MIRGFCNYDYDSRLVKVAVWTSGWSVPLNSTAAAIVVVFVSVTGPVYAGDRSDTGAPSVLIRIERPSAAQLRRGNRPSVVMLQEQAVRWYGGDGGTVVRWYGGWYGGGTGGKVVDMDTTDAGACEQ